MEREAVVSGLDSVGVTASGLKPGTEGDVIGREQWKAIHER